MRGHLSFGGHDFGELFYCHAEKPLLPPMEVAELTVDGMDGARFSRSTARPVEIEAVMVLREPKQSQERLRAVVDDVAGHLAAKDAELYLPGYEDRCYMASVSGTSSIEEFVSTARLRVTFRASSPFMLGRKRSAEIVDGSNTVKRGGNAPAAFVFTGKTMGATSYIRLRKGTATANPRVILYANKLNDDDAWDANVPIVIDMGNRIATANGARWPININSDFWLLDESTNVHATSVEGAIEWRETWL